MLWSRLRDTTSNKKGSWLIHFKNFLVFLELFLKSIQSRSLFAFLFLELTALWVPKWDTFVLTSGDWVWDWIVISGVEKTHPLWQASCIWEQGDVIISIFSSFSKVSSTPRSNEMLAVKIYSVGFLFVLAARGSFQSKFFRHWVMCNFSC